MSIQLTILNSMAGKDFDRALDQHVSWQLSVLDLKNEIYGKAVEHLTPQEAERVSGAAAARGLHIHTLSTTIFDADIEQGEQAFRARYLPDLERILQTAPILRPRVIRLIAARSSQRSTFANSADYVTNRHPWLISLYRDAIDRINAVGFAPVIENEVNRCLFSHPGEILDFFAALDRSGSVKLIWDIANLWEEGTYPSLEVYTALKPLIGLVHLKGGRADKPGGRLRWASTIREASYPVLEIASQIAADGVVDVICLNPSHGERSDGYREDVEGDIRFLRQHM